MLRGEVLLLNLNPTIGAEIRKTRSVIIVNDDEIGALPLKVVVPVTNWKERFEEVLWMTKIDPNDENFGGGRFSGSFGFAGTICQKIRQSLIRTARRDFRSIGNRSKNRELMPATTMVEVSKLIDPEMLIEIEADAEL
jgi:hypothetical protein